MTRTAERAMPKAAPKIRRESDAERGLATLIQWAGLPEPEREFRFHETRMWRLDFAYPSHMVAVEVEGGGFVDGRHTRGDGFERDCEKHSAAAALGWRVLRVTPRHIEDKVAVVWLRDALNVPPRMRQLEADLAVALKLLDLRGGEWQ